jgi:O-acetylhomoserine (thiol)-lyase
MTHSHMSPTQLAEAHIGPTTVRLSIGLEDPRDIVDDLARSLDQITLADATAELAESVVRSPRSRRR